MSQDGEGEPPSNVFPFKGKRDLASNVARERQMVELRMSGLNYRQIGEHLGYSGARVHEIVVGALALEPAKRAEATALEVARYDRQLAALWPAVLNGDINANRVALEISKHRRSLLGLDEPTRIDVSPAASDVQAMVNSILALQGQPQDIVDADVIEDDVLDGDVPAIEQGTPDVDPLDEPFTWD